MHRHEAPGTRRQIRKVLIANRGEIAVRITQACHELGKEAVAVYSEADRGALHVQRADEAYPIGPAPAGESYLNIGAIIQAARRSGADALHPGYGFLAENAALAEACREAGLVFIGPSPEAMRTMGDKAAAKELARRAGVPVVPGYSPRGRRGSHANPFPEGAEAGGGRSEGAGSRRPEQRPGEGRDRAGLVRAAGRIGYPLLVKAAAGGGGRGMRVVEEAGALREALAAAAREADAAFGDGRLILERYVSPARHVEVQVMGDTHGNVVALGERDCSLQRRHQKVMEEAPAPGLHPATRQALLDAAIRLAQAIGYLNAGTVEFILDAEGRFHFLEMNTRLQVEHGVTELVTGLDLVHLQIRVAEGEPLETGTPSVRGHAIECRIYAEDPFEGFRPSSGRLLLFEPPQGPGIRNDVGVSPGDAVSPYYDAQLAKVLVHGTDRANAIARVEDALRRYVVAGVATNLPLLRAVAAGAVFREGTASTRYLEEELAPRLRGQGRTMPPEEALMGAAAFEMGRAAPTGAPAANPWLAGGAGLLGGARRFRYRAGEREWTVTATQGRSGWVFDAGDGPRNVQWRQISEHRLLLEREGRQTAMHVAPAPDGVAVVHEGESFLLRRPPRARATARLSGGGASARGGLTAPMPALVARVLATEGQAVSAHQTLVVLQAMKMEHLIQAPAAGVVRAVHCHEGQSVPEGAVLVELGEEPAVLP